MTFRLTFLFVIIALLSTMTFGQADSVIGQVSNSAAESFAGGISGDGRFVVFESRGNLATENPRNADNNTEIFLFDYAQRRIFQITDTKSVLFDPTAPAIFSNVRVEITNTRPVISNDGRWIAFSSNATSSTPLAPNSSNPGSFDGNAFTSPTPTPSPTATATPTATPTGSPTATPTPAANPLTADGNLEMWLYEIPVYAPVADLSAGAEIPLTDLAGGSFIPVTNTNASQTPLAGTSTTGPFIAEDNHDASISDDGSVLAFVSTRDLVPTVGNPTPPPLPGEDNDEIFTYVRSTATLGQVTKTPRGPISNPIYNKNPTISGDGLRVAFASTGDNPIVGMTGGSNPQESRNEEIFYADLINGSPTAETTKKQVTVTASTNPGEPVNLLDLGRRMSRDGRFIAFDSHADLAAATPGANLPGFALFVYDVVEDSFRQIGPRSDADAAALGGDVQRFPGFTDYDAARSPRTLVLETRLNITPTGTIPTTASDGLNPLEIRPAQIYSFPFNPDPSDPPPAIFTRLANFPAPTAFIASTQLLTSNSLERMAFNLGLSELGLGNPDFLAEVFYFIQPTANTQTPVSINVATGASRQPVSFTALPTPSATPSPTATPTATPTGSPSPTPSASPTPTPVTPPAVFGISPGMLAILDYQAGVNQPVVARTAVGSIMRSFSLPIELSGVTMTINGAACGLKSVSQHRIEFVVPPALFAEFTGTSYPLVINNNGVVMKSTVTIVPTRPDLFNREMFASPGGRAKLFNVTNTVHRTEPFTVRTIRRKGNTLVPTVLRIYMTGVQNVSAGLITVRIGDQSITGTSILSGASIVEPGVYTFDFELPAALDGAGDQPVVVTINVDGQIFTTRLDDTAARVAIL